MTGVVALLDPQAQSELRRTLNEHRAGGAGEFPELLDETLAALTVVGQHPPHLRPFALTIVARTAREQLLAHRLIELSGTDWPSAASEPIGWGLTAKGEEMADLLAAAIPDLSEPERQRAEEMLAAMIAETNRELGIDDPATSCEQPSGSSAGRTSGTVGKT